MAFCRDITFQFGEDGGTAQEAGEVFVKRASKSGGGGEAYTARPSAPAWPFSFYSVSHASQLSWLASLKARLAGRCAATHSGGGIALRPGLGPFRQSPLCSLALHSLQRSFRFAGLSRRS